MKILIFTQKIDKNDDILGFFHRWVEEFATRSEKVHVVCLFKGEHDLPDNVKVLSLGKEEGVSRLKYLSRFFKYVWKYRRDYDAVFVHMNQIYVILGGIFWRLFRKKIVLWYAHGSTSISLQIATIFANKVVTSTESGFRLKSKKKKVVGQGIDTKKFGYCFADEQNLNLIFVGRISPIKKLETFIEAASILKEKGLEPRVIIVGGIGISTQDSYLEKLKKMVLEKRLDDDVFFAGPVPHKDLPDYLCKSQIFINPSQTGSLDKTGIEAMASGIPVITCNEAYSEIIGGLEDRLMFKKDDATDLAEKIISFHESEDKRKISLELRRIVEEGHSIKKLIPKILKSFNER